MITSRLADKPFKQLIVIVLIGQTLTMALVYSNRLQALIVLTLVLHSHYFLRSNPGNNLDKIRQQLEKVRTGEKA